jgi:sugar phosphate isomerase/epimerase
MREKMYEPYQRYFDLSLVHFMAYPSTIRGEGPILETLTRIAEDPFFTAVEVGPINDDKIRKEASEILEQAHMRVVFGAQPILLLGKLNLNSPDEGERKKAIEAIKGGVDQAYDLNAERLGLLSGPAPEESKREEQKRLLVDSLKQICEYAEERGNLGITLETFDPQTDKAALIGGSHKEAAEIAEAVKEEDHDFGILVDLSHLPMQALRPPYETPRKALSAVSDHLVHVHIGNCLIDNPSHPAYGDKHPRFGIGENDVPEVKEFIEALFDVGFLGGGDRPIVGFEVSPMKGESSEIVIANAKRVFNQAWAGVEVR